MNDEPDGFLPGLWGLMLGVGLGMGLACALEDVRAQGFREGRAALIYALDAERARRARLLSNCSAHW